MNEFEQAASKANAGIGRELVYFLRQSKKWWLLPILITLLVFALAMVLSSTALAPFIYTLF